VGFLSEGCEFCVEWIHAISVRCSMVSKGLSQATLQGTQVESQKREVLLHSFSVRGRKKSPGWREYLIPELSLPTFLEPDLSGSN